MDTDQVRRAQFDRLSAVETEAHEIINRAASAARSTTPDEDARFESLVAQGARIKLTLDQMDEGKAVAAMLRRHPAVAPSDAHAKALDPIRDQLESRERQHDYSYPTSDELNANLGDETRAISDFANSSALFVNDFTSQVAVFARTLSPYIGLAHVVTSDNGRPLVVPQITGDPTIYTPGEGTAITTSDVTLASVTVTPAGYKGLMYISAEAWEDEDINISQQIARCQARALSLAFGSAATTAILGGSGVNNGGTATGTGGNGTATSTFVGYEDLIDLQMSRAADYRAKGIWIMSNGAIKKVRKFRDGQGQYLWPSEDLASGQPASLLGGQVYEDPYLVAPASATKSVLYGDPNAGLIVKATPIRVAVSSDFKFDTDQIAIKTTQRIALAVQDPAAMAFLVSANS